MPRGCYPRTSGDPISRFLCKIEKSSNGCWMWTGAIMSFGYGSFQMWKETKRAEPAHRAAWLLFRGAIPDGLCVCHTCDNPPCVNPDHLYIATHAENMADKIRKGRCNYPIGSRCGTAKLTEQDIPYIRQSTEGVTALARKFGVGRTAIRRVRSGRGWKHV
jgi:hypothetical protein